MNTTMTIAEQLQAVLSLASRKDARPNMDAYLTKKDLANKLEAITGDIVSVKKHTRQQLLDIIQETADYYSDPELVAESEEDYVPYDNPEAEDEALASLPSGQDSELQELDERSDRENDGSFYEHEEEEREYDAWNPEHANPEESEDAEMVTKAMKAVVVAAIRQIAASGLKAKNYIGLKYLQPILDVSIINDTDKELCKALYFVPHNSSRSEGFLVKPYFMAMTYNKAVLTYHLDEGKAAGFTYELCAQTMTIKSLASGKEFPLTEENCSLLDNAFLVSVTEARYSNVLYAGDRFELNHPVSCQDFRFIIRKKTDKMATVEFYGMPYSGKTEKAELPVLYINNRECINVFGSEEIYDYLFAGEQLK